MTRLIAALLLLVLSGAVLAGCGGSDESAEPVDNGGSDSATSPLDSAPTDPVPATVTPPVLPELTERVTEFYSPTRNIACHLDERTDGDGDDTSSEIAGCHVFTHDFPDPSPPADCEGDLLAVVKVGVTGAATYGECRGDPFALPTDTLNYGSATLVGRFACLSESTGVTCWNTETRHGFTVARESYQLF